MAEEDDRNNDHEGGGRLLGIARITLFRNSLAHVEREAAVGPRGGGFQLLVPPHHRRVVVDTLYVRAPPGFSTTVLYEIGRAHV